MTDYTYEHNKNCRFDEQSSDGSFFAVFRIYSQTAVRDLDMLSVEKRSCPIYVAGRRRSRDTELTLQSVLISSGRKECILSSLTVYASAGVFYTYK